MRNKPALSAIVAGVGALALNGCGGNDAADTVAESALPAGTSISGKIAYRRTCADCHESGKNDAPPVGDPEAWRGRSSLWEAVLFEHAKDGYFDMPAKGGREELSDDEVEAAAEYMLSITHPDRLPDQ